MAEGRGAAGPLPRLKQIAERDLEHNPARHVGGVQCTCAPSVVRGVCAERLGVKTTRQLAHIERVNADLWIVTETPFSVELPGYNRVATQENGYPRPGELCRNSHTAGA